MSKTTTVFVLGDVMLDRFVHGRVDRISPEAPVPVFTYESEETMLGGAGNVARNIVSMGGTAILCGVAGRDADGDQLMSAVGASGIQGRLIQWGGDSSPRQTTVKTRYVASGQQVMRHDRESAQDVSRADADLICGKLFHDVSNIGALVLSDYAKGVLTPNVVRRAIEIATANKVPVIVDPKGTNPALYAGATVLTPNAAEAYALTGVDAMQDAPLAASTLYQRANVQAVIVTLGAKGMLVFDGINFLKIKTSAREVLDVSGAGDTVVAGVALTLASGGSILQAARLGSAAAGLAVEKRGTAVVTFKELVELNDKVRDSTPGPKSLEDTLAEWRARGLKIGFTNGCFDLLHPGHVSLFTQARARCDRLIVGLNSDNSVRRLKGAFRPVQTQTARADMLRALKSVDLVLVFEEDTPINMIEKIRPDVLVKGGDYKREEIVGADFVESYGGEVVIVPIKEGYSTTAIIASAAA